jgi:hypothetical protein
MFRQPRDERADVTTAPLHLSLSVLETMTFVHACWE